MACKYLKMLRLLCNQLNGRVTGVDTCDGKIDADYVVNCAGMWGREVGLMANTAIPLHANEHFYVVTEPIAELTPDLPVLRVPDEHTYYKEDAGKFLLGAFEPVSKPWGMGGIPKDFEFDQLPEDFDHFEPILEAACERMPMLAEAGIQTFFNGPESFTPDDAYHLGLAPELDNFWVAAGFNSIGIQSAGGAGMALAEWMDTGSKPFDLGDVDISRMQPFQGNKKYLFERSKETLGLLYADHFPFLQKKTARNIRRTPFHHQLLSQGAVMGEIAGWERANWFSEKDQKASYEYSWKRQNWFDNAARRTFGHQKRCWFLDLSSFAKFRVEGRDAEAVLQKIMANDVSVEIGKIVYGQWLNKNGGIEADLTVTRISETVFFVVTSANKRKRNFSWFKRHIPEGANCIITDVTSAEAVFCLMGL